MNLYEIDKNISDLWEKILRQDGELTEEDAKLLESLSLARDTKLKGYGVLIRESVSWLASINLELARLSKLKKQTESKIDWLTNRLSTYMQENNILEYKSIEVNITFRPSTSLEIEDGCKLDSKWLRTKTEPDKQAIKDFISNGGVVEGCKIVEKQNIQIK